MTKEHYNSEHFSNSTLKFYFINFFQFVWNGNLIKTKKVFSITVIVTSLTVMTMYSVFHRFRQAKFAYFGSNLSLSKFSLLPSGL